MSRGSMLYAGAFLSGYRWRDCAARLRKNRRRQKKGRPLTSRTAHCPFARSGYCTVNCALPFWLPAPETAAVTPTVYDPVVVPPPPPPPPPPPTLPLPQPIITSTPVSAKVQRRAHSSFLLPLFRTSPIPKTAKPGTGNHSATPVRLAEPVLTVVMVSVAVTLPLAASVPEGAPTEQVGGVAAVPRMAQLRLTVPLDPVELTVTVDIPLLPRLIVLG